jgi:hypothetical protein
MYDLKPNLSRQAVLGEGLLKICREFFLCIIMGDSQNLALLGSCSDVNF